MSNDQFSEACRLYDCGLFGEAFVAFLALAEHGDESSMVRLALMYEVGEGVDQDLAESEAWDFRAIQLGSPIAMLNRGITFERSGKIGDARALFKKGCELGDGEAALCLAKLEMQADSDVREIKKLLRLSISSKFISEDSIEEAKNILNSIRE